MVDSGALEALVNCLEEFDPSVKARKGTGGDVWAVLGRVFFCHGWVWWLVMGMVGAVGGCCQWTVR